MMNPTYQLRLGGPLRGTAHLPASKSICNRALLMAQLAGGGWQVENVSDCDDTAVLLRALAQPASVVDVGAAGTAMRFLAARLSALPGERVLTGSARMRRRPIGILVDALRRIGADIRYEADEGYPPLRIRGARLHGGALELPASVSSQYVSALLMIAPAIDGGLRLALDGEIVSRPYIDMTLGLMRRFGADACWEDGRTLRVAPRPYAAEGRFTVEADWSAASYWYELAALSSDAGARVFLPGLSPDSLQGDAAVRRYFEPLGVRSVFRDGGVELSKGPLAAECCRLDLTDCPDLAQTLVVTCAMLGLPFRFTGLQSLKIKETDRIAALRRELSKLGIDVSEEGGSELRWDGRRCPAEDVPSIDTYDDHRMAMSFAPAALRRPGLRVCQPGVVSKSYPGFWRELAGVFGPGAVQEA